MGPGAATITKASLASTLEEIPNVVETLFGGCRSLGQQTPLHGDEVLDPR